MWPNPQFPADFVTCTKEILNGKLHFLCSVLMLLILWVNLLIHSKYRKIRTRNKCLFGHFSSSAKRYKTSFGKPFTWFQTSSRKVNLDEFRYVILVARLLMSAVREIKILAVKMFLKFIFFLEISLTFKMHNIQNWPDAFRIS